MYSVVLHNGMCNRLLPLISLIRIAKQTNKIVNIIWTYTPVRSCLAYHGDLCSFEDLFQKTDILRLEENIDMNIQEIYEFRYWENKDHVVDKSKDNIFVNYALYTIISNEDDMDTMFKNLRLNIPKPQQIILDNIGKEYGSILLNDIKPIQALQKEIDSMYKTFFKNMIGIHIRRSDGGFSNYNWVEIIKRILSQCKEWCVESDNGIFLATDDMDTYVQFASCLGSKLIFYNPPDVLCNCKSTSDNKFSNDKYNTLSAVVELYLLGKCNKYIIGTADSTFSVCAILMSSEGVKNFLINDVSNIPTFI